jgi:hypothetical protein
MNRPGALSLCIFPMISLAALTLSAESSGRDNAQPAVVYQVPVSLGCPVGVRAEHGTGGGMLWVRDGRSVGIGQQIQLTLSNPKSVGIVGADIVVHGNTAKGRVLPAHSGQAGSSEIAKTLELKLPVGAKEDASTDLFLRAFTSVTSIDLNAVQYADGSIWRASTLQSCHIAPDGVMLISSR